MARPRELKVELNADERKQLERGCRSGDWKARKISRARILILADVGVSAEQRAEPFDDTEIAERVGCSHSTVGNVRKRFQSERLGALEEKPRPGRPKVIDGTVEAKMIAIACSESPEGRERWTVRLIRDKLVELLDEVDTLSHSTVGKALKKMNLSRG